MLTLTVLSAFAAEPLAPGVYGPPAPEVAVADGTEPPAQPEVIQAPTHTPARMTDHPMVQTGLTISKVATIGGAVGLGMLVVGSVVYATGTDTATQTAAATLQTGGTVVLATAAPGYVAGPIVTAQGIQAAGGEVEVWPGWTAVGLFAGAFAFPLLGETVYPDQQQILNIAGIGSAIGGAVLINTQESMNRRALAVRPGPGGVSVGGAF
jgi:hypothetical protein